MHLVLDANLDLFLLGWDYTVLRCALEVWELCHSLLDDVKSLLNFLLGDDQRRSKANNVLVGGFGLYTVSLRSVKYRKYS